MKRIHCVILSGLLLLASLSISGCNTIRGFGQDVQSGGQAIERAGDR